MFKVVAVIIQVTTAVCGPQTGQQCQLSFADPNIGRATFYSLAECLERAQEIRSQHLMKGENYLTFCAKFHGSTVSELREDATE